MRFVETIWVLSSYFDQPRDNICDAIEKMAAMPIFMFESPAFISQLIQLAPITKADLPDLLIGLTGRTHNCEATLTFDKQAAQSDLFELL